MSNSFNQAVDVIDATLKANSFIENPDNVYAGEYYGGRDLLPDSAFPRLEFVDHGEDNYTYISQHTIQPVQWFSITGFIKHEDSKILAQNKERMKRTGTFMRETCASIFRFNLLKQNNTLGIDGFVQMHPLFHIDSYQEVLSRVDSFFFIFGMEVSRAWYNE